jgi:hypothetical protein
MDGFETATEEADQSSVADDEREAKRAKFREGIKSVLKRMFTFLSFGPGVLGFLWLIGRILRR